MEQTKERGGALMRLMMERNELQSFNSVFVTPETPSFRRS